MFSTNQIDKTPIIQGANIGGHSPARTLMDLMKSASLKSRQLSLLKSTKGLLRVTLQNRIAKVINHAICTNSLHIDVNALDKAFIDAAPMTTVASADLASCMSEDLASCMSEEFPFGFAVIGDEPNAKIAHMDFSSETDNGQQPGDEDYVLQRCPGWICGEEDECEEGEYEEEEADDAVFERLMTEYDYDNHLYQEYNKHGYNSCNIHTLCGNVSEEDEDLLGYDDMRDFYEQYYFD